MLIGVRSFFKFLRDLRGVMGGVMSMCGSKGEVIINK